jgi:hypothetical protein
MSENENLDRDEDLYDFSRERLFPSPQRLFVGIHQRQLVHQRPVPSSCNPIGHIYFISHTLRTLASGNIRWWVIVVAGLVFGIRFLLALWAIFPSVMSMGLLLLSLKLLMELPLLVIPLINVWRGTKLKLCARKLRRPR